jgi:class 3 adenylate cyclase
MARLNTEIDVRCILPTIKAPTLVLHRREDKEVQYAEIAHTSAIIPGARLVQLDGADHLHWSINADDVIAEMQEFITGVRPAPVVDSALVTVLYTDIVNSTLLAADLGDHRWNELLRRHDDVIADELRRHQGRKINTTGDGVLAAFDSPGRGIRAAMAIRHALQTLDLHVRAGVHTGECELHNGAPSGIALHIGARVAALADAGEILTSRTVRDLAVGAGLCFQDRGKHQLKGVPGEWRIYSVA